MESYWRRHGQFPALLSGLLGGQRRGSQIFCWLNSKRHMISYTGILSNSKSINFSLKSVIFLSNNWEKSPCSVEAVNYWYILYSKARINFMQKWKRFFDDPPSMTHETVDGLLQDSLAAKAPANESHTSFQKLHCESFQMMWLSIWLKWI